MGQWDSAEPLYKRPPLEEVGAKNVRTVLLCGGSIDTNNGHTLWCVALFSRIGRADGVPGLNLSE